LEAKAGDKPGAVAEAGGDCVVVKLRQTYLTFYYGTRRNAPRILPSIPTLG